VNDEFFNSWQKRTGNTTQEPTTKFDGATLKLDLSITFDESVQIDPLVKSVFVQR